MEKFSRRHLILASGLSAASGYLVSGVLERAGNTAGAAPSEVNAPGHGTSGNSATSGSAAGSAWRYHPLDPRKIADQAYELYPDGSCMYAVVGSVIGALADIYGEPYRSFPVQMTRYGRLGIGQWGTACGVFNGAAMLVGLFFPEKDATTRDALISEFAVWYESTLLPQYVPLKAGWAEEVPPAVPGSVVCHISVANWCKATGFDAFCAEKRERCRRLAADGAAKIVDILNRHAPSPPRGLQMSPVTKTCVKCHGERELADSRGFGRCDSCHTQLSPDHPRMTSSMGAGE